MDPPPPPPIAVLEIRTWREWLAVAEDAVRFLWSAHHLTREWHDSESGWLARTAAADDDADAQDQEHRGMAYPRAKPTEGESAAQTNVSTMIWRDEEAFLRDLRALMASVRDERTRAANRLRAGPPSPPVDYPASFGQLSAQEQWKVWFTSLLKCYEAGVVPAESESEERHQAHAAVTILLGLQQLSGCAWLSFARISEIEKSVVACRLEFDRAEQLNGAQADVLLPMGLAAATAPSSSSSTSIIEFQCPLASFFFLYHELSSKCAFLCRSNWFADVRAFYRVTARPRQFQGERLSAGQRRSSGTTCCLCVGKSGGRRS